MASHFGTLGNDTLDFRKTSEDRVGIFGNKGNDLIFGVNGDDTLIGGDGNDTIYAEPGNDLLFGSNGDDGLYGRDGDDRLIGGPGKDQLYGDDGNDTLFADNVTIFDPAGSDTLTGGSGADNFYFFSRPAGGINYISDFSEDDKIVIISKSGFKATSTDQFSYDDITGALFFDASSSDDLEPIQFASLSPNLGGIFSPSEDIVLSSENITLSAKISDSSNNVQELIVIGSGNTIN